jgi:hypothetical protein
MNMADVIPAILVLLFGLVFALAALMVWVVTRLRRRSVVLLNPADFVPAHVVSCRSSLTRSRPDQHRRALHAPVRRTKASQCESVHPRRTALRSGARRPWDFN